MTAPRWPEGRRREDDAELHRLRERVYGVDGANASADDLERLAALEERERRVAVDGDTADDPRPSVEPDAPEAEAEEPEAVTRAPRAALRWGGGAVGALALLGIGVAIGASLSAPTVPADPAAAELPELTFPQTVEDVISADILRDSGIDPASTRYIATVSDFRIYLARPDDGDGRCIATFTSTDNRPWTAGCASGAQTGAAVFGIDDSLTVAIGDPVDAEVPGIPIRLSDSVTAYVAG